MSVKETLHYDQLSDVVTVHRQQDVDPILQSVREHKDRGADRKASESMGYFVGTIPAVIVEEYCKQEGITYHEFCEDSSHVRRILSDPDYKKFRIWEGRL